MKYALINGTIYTAGAIYKNKVLIISDGFIDSIVEANEFKHDCATINVENLHIAPGFIDLQVNGGGGVLFNDELTYAGIKTIAEAHRRFGTTNLLITMISPSKEMIVGGIAATAEAVRQGDLGVLGLHVEGPYIATEKAGIHPLDYIRELTQAELLELIATGEHAIKIMTVAPEMVTDELIQEMVKHDIVVSLGHSNCTYKEAVQAFAAGASNVTHLFNAMSPLGSREPGLVGAALSDNRVWCGIIPDGHHVSFPTLKLAYQLKKDKLFIVTDAMSPVGSAITEFTVGDDLIYCSEGKCVNAKGTLAGSSLNMMDAVKNCVRELSIPLDEALRMASTYPAKAIQMEHTLGKIKAGYTANLTIFNDSYEVEAVVLNGHYRRF